MPLSLNLAWSGGLGTKRTTRPLGPHRSDMLAAHGAVTTDSRGKLTVTNSVGKNDRLRPSCLARRFVLWTKLPEAKAAGR